MRNTRNVGEMEQTNTAHQREFPTTLFVVSIRNLTTLNTSVEITGPGRVIGRTGDNVLLKVPTNTAQILPAIRMFAMDLIPRLPVLSYSSSC